MANTQKYLNHLLQNTGITPACSEEEREAADVIAAIFKQHGFEPEVQEFNASATPKVVQAVLGILVFLGVILAMLGGIPGVIGLLLALAVAVVYTVERLGKPVLSQLGTGGPSQNVIAYHKASGPLASPRNRPVVVVAHYDSPRADFMAQEPFSKYRPLVYKLLPYCMVAPAIVLVVRLLPFPTGIKTFLWIVAVAAALVPLLNAVAIIANRFVLPYTSGSVCNKSSVAAMLGVMDDVAPYEGREEFPDDIPFDEYFSEQVRIAEEALAAAEAERQAREAARAAKRGEPVEDVDEAAADATAVESVEPAAETASFAGAGEAASTMVTPAADATAEVGAVGAVDDEELDEVPAVDTPAVDAPTEPEPAAEPEPAPERVAYPLVNSQGNIRFGEEVVRSLGMLAESCVIVYEEPEPDEAGAGPVGAAEAAEAVGAAGVVPQDGADHIPAQQAPYAVLDDGEPDADEPDWQFEPEPIPVMDFYGEDDGEPAESVLDTLRDGASRLISFVKSKVSAISAEKEPDSELEPEPEPELESELGPADAEERPGDAEGGFVGFDDLPASDEAPGPSDEGEAPATPAEVAETPVEEPAVEKTVERTAVVADAAAVQPDAAATRSDVATTQQNAPAPQQVDTVDSLMAEISAASAPAPTRPAPQRVLNVPSIADAPAAQNPSVAGRSALFDLPDPSETPVDPLASYDVGAGAATGGRGAQDAESMSEWLGLGSDYDAKKSGREIGSWANFESDSSWKGGATSSTGADEGELREAVTSLGDDELLGHDIWFVAAGASENGNAGVEAFLKEHRSSLRGVFLINLECVGAGQVAMIATEGKDRVLKGDRRIMNLVQHVSADFHHEFGSIELPYLATDAYAAMSMSLRSLTIGGVDGTGFALSHSEEDQPYNVNPDNIAIVADVVTEVIRRS